MKRILCFLAFIFFMSCLVNCTTSYKISNQNLSLLYDPSENYLHPHYLVYHFREDSSKLFVTINPTEVLYKRNENGDAVSQLIISYKLFKNIESKEIIDSASYLINDINESGVSNMLVHSVNFKTPIASKYILYVDLKDNFRQQSAKAVINIDKLNKQSAQYFILKSENISFPLFRNYVDADETFYIIRPDTTTYNMFVRCYFRNFPLAAPPFAEKPPLKFEYAADSIYTIEVSNTTKIKLERNGFYHFQLDTAQKPGLTIFRFDDDFPKITNASQLLEALRFLTTKEEYNNMSMAGDKKAAIDNYWLDLAGNEQRAKILIKKYYTRVQDANLFFTSFLEGWKTDRGLIYTIYGSPTTVYKSTTTEDWTYGNYTYNSSLTFTFEKIYNPFSENDFILRRSKYYEDPWYRAVDRWRQGVVTND